MFISIPKEFFVPVIFGDAFTLNEENNNLELDLNMYRESTGKKSNNNYNLEKNKEYLDNSKTAKEKQDIVDIEVTMDEKQCGNKEETQGSITNINENLQNNSNISKKIINKECKVEDGAIIYMSLKEEGKLDKMCDRQMQIFSDLDEEFLEKIDINGCDDKK